MNPEVAELSGSTGTVLLVQEDYFIIANAGDSPIVIFRTDPNNKNKFIGEQLSIDHKPDLEGEYQRIIASDGLLE